MNFEGAGSASTNYGLQDTSGEIGSGESASSIYKVKAGFQQMQEVYLSLSSASNVTMSPAINGLTGGIGNGNASWTVTTDNAAGYTMSIRAGTSPALKGVSSSFADYAPSGGAPSFGWSVSAANSAFGFSPEGGDIDQRFKDNGSTCNTGSLDTTNSCWDGLAITDKTIATRTSGNQPNGTTTTVKLRAESGASHIQPNDTYTASIVVTVLPL